MRIVFLGSSHGVPEPHRRCSSTLIEVGESRYIIDMGCQSIEDLINRNISPDSIKGIFITHMHGDHTNGLLSFLDLSSWKFKTVDPVIFLPGQMEDTVNAIRGWIQCNGVTLRDFRFQPVNEGVLFDDGVIRVTAFRTKHIAYSYAYLIEAEGKRVFFSGDLRTKGPQEDFPMSVLEKPLDLAICESAHFQATAYLPLLQGQTNLKKLCINHYSEYRLSSVLEMPAALPEIPVLRAHDGMEITL